MAKPIPKALLATRKQAAEMLGGISIQALTELERDGILTPVRLRPTINSHVLYKVEQLEALANGSAGEPPPADKSVVKRLATMRARRHAKRR